MLALAQLTLINLYRFHRGVNATSHIMGLIDCESCEEKLIGFARVSGGKNATGHTLLSDIWLTHINPSSEQPGSTRCGQSRGRMAGEQDTARAEDEGGGRQKGSPD